MSVSFSMDKKMKVCVIGAGIIGLSSAVRIQERIPDVDITIIADNFTPNTCSDGSGGFWEPFLLPKDAIEQASRWCKETWDLLYGIVQSPDAGEYGIHLVSGFNFTDIHIPSDPLWKDIVFGYRRLTASERKLHPENKDGVTYTTIMVNVKKYLPRLMTQFRLKNGKVIWKTVGSIDEISREYDLVVNCTGVGANKLGDPSVVPIRGQVIRVKAPWVKHFYFDNDPTEKKNKLYIFPGKDYVLLGGTSQTNDWKTKVNTSDTKRILDGCSRLVPSLKKAEILEQWVGLRPSRPSIRIEKETKNIGGKTITIIHNYGHGGSGITLFWGCAQDTADLVYNSYTNTNLHSRL